MNVFLIVGLFHTIEMLAAAEAAIADKQVQLPTGNYRFVVAMFANHILICPVLWKTQ